MQFLDEPHKKPKTLSEVTSSTGPMFRSGLGPHATPGPGLLSARRRTCSKGTCVSHTLFCLPFAHVPPKVGPLMHDFSWGEEAGPWQHALITLVLRLLPLPSVALAQFAFICL